MNPNLNISADFFNGKSVAQPIVPASEIVHSAKSAGKKLINWPIHRILDIFDQFSQHLLSRTNPLHALFPSAGLAFIAQWCRRNHLESILKTAFEDLEILDRFVQGNGRNDRFYRVYPRGLVVHWMAGNVPTLGFLSLIQGMLTKNINIIKSSSDSDTFLSRLLEQMGEIEPDSSMSGRRLVESVAVIRYDHNQIEAGNYLSKQADARVFWGSDESVKLLKQLPTGVGTHDIVFPNKTSAIVIGKRALDESDQFPGISRKIAADVSIFEQKACASPHTIFLETTNDGIVEAFAQTLKSALTQALRSHPKIMPSSTERTAILNLRSEYDMFHRAWYSDGIEFTILSDDKLKLGPPIGNRTIFLRKVKELSELAELITPNVQTIGILADANQYEQLTNLFGAMGAQRFTKLGMMTHFESPWDGYNMPQNFVRWTSRQSSN